MLDAYDSTFVKKPVEIYNSRISRNHPVCQQVNIFIIDLMNHSPTTTPASVLCSMTARNTEYRLDIILVINAISTKHISIQWAYENSALCTVT